MITKSTVLYTSDHFTYLGSVMSTSGGADEDVKSRINKANVAFNMLRPIWNSNALSLHTKLRIFYTNVKAVLLYGSESWRVTKYIASKLQTFINRCLRRILHIRWPEKISNATLWERTGQDKIEISIKKRKWGWIGHTLRKPPDDITRQSLEWNPQGRRRVGRPRQSWKRSIQDDLKRSGKTWAQTKKEAPNRVRWRSVVTALCLDESQRE